MATRTTEDTLAEIRWQIDELEARAVSDLSETRASLEDRFVRLREEEAAAWAAVRDRAEIVDEKVRQLEIDIGIAASRLASVTADDRTSFVEAVEAELHGWDDAIERLQLRAVTMAHEAREHAEATIAELRDERTRAASLLAAVRTSADDAWQEEKSRVTAALEGVERDVRAAAPTFSKGERHDN